MNDTSDLAPDTQATNVNGLVSDYRYSTMCAGSISRRNDRDRHLRRQKSDDEVCISKPSLICMIADFTPLDGYLAETLLALTLHSGAHKWNCFTWFTVTSLCCSGQNSA